MKDIAIQVHHLSKLYRIGRAQQRHDTLRDAISDFGSRISNFLRSASKPHPDSRTPTSEDTIWALRDVSFEVRRGEVVGIIGRNGAGKTTLLKILSRITEPTAGYAEIHGRVGSLLEVGTGFHPELTGRENIYLNGAILGMRRAEIERKFDEIVAFAEIEKFLDTPVKRYSSGMYVRLAFAVAAHLEPEILLVDEVLAVGDAAFQKKCLGKMGDVAREGRTVLFVSHNMAAIARLCQKTLWLYEGHLRMNSATGKVVSNYLTSGASMDGEKVWDRGIANPGVDEFRIRSIRIRNDTGQTTSVLDAKRSFWVEIEYELLERVPPCRVGIIITTVEGATVFETYDADNEDRASPREPGVFISKCEIPANFLNLGHYVVSVNAGIPNFKNLAFLEGSLVLLIEDVGAVGSHMCGQRRGIVRPRLTWEQERLR